MPAARWSDAREGARERRLGAGGGPHDGRRQRVAARVLRNGRKRRECMATFFRFVMSQNGDANQLLISTQIPVPLFDRKSLAFWKLLGGGQKVYSYLRGCGAKDT